MFLTGTFHRSVDEKFRVGIPKPLREAIESGTGGVLYVAPGTDGSLSLYPEEGFSNLAARLGEVSPTARQVRDYTRLFFARACRVELDKQGRIRIPQELAELIGLGRDAVLLGVHDHLELWDQQQWKHYLEDRQGQYDQLAEAAFGNPGEVVPESLPAGTSLRVPK